MSVSEAILVTGASTGIGRKITERLARSRCFVYAGARKDVDLRDLSAVKNVEAVRLDVTKSADIASAVKRIGDGGQRLHGIVNNAGVVTLNSVLDTSEEEFDLTMAVNVRGAYLVTKAFAPLLVRSKGRIVIIGSITGIIAAENHSAYSMSKHALEAFTDSLALELEPLGLRVSVIEPGSFKSELVPNACERAGLSRQARDRSMLKEPDEVAAAVESALFEPNPKRRYLVVPDQLEARLTIERQIVRLVQLNERQPHSYPRSALIEILDAVLNQSQA